MPDPTPDTEAGPERTGEPDSLIPFDPTELAEDRAERRTAISIGLPGFYVGNWRGKATAAEMTPDLCSEHGAIRGDSIAGHLLHVHGIEYDDYRRDIERATPSQPVPSGLDEALFDVLSESFVGVTRPLATAIASDLRARLTTAPAAEESVHQDDDGNPTYPGHREAVPSQPVPSGLDWQAIIEAAPTEDDARAVYRLIGAEWFESALAATTAPAAEGSDRT